MNRYDLLRRFHDISPKDYELLTAALQARSFKKGEYIVVPGQTQKELYFVNSGVQMSFFESEKKMHVMAFTYYPDLCAIPESFALQLPSKCFLSCVTDSDTEFITYNDLQQLFDRSQAIERLFRRMTEAVLAGLISRHIELHSMSMQERYSNFLKRSPHLLQLVPHKYLASYLGIDPTNFSKLLNTVKI